MAHEGDTFTCPQCGETSTRMSPDQFRAGLLAIRAMFSTEEEDFMSVRCKFKVDSITQHANNGATVSMSPVYANNDPQHENSKFWKYTPSGEFKFNCVNPDAVAQLELGAEYYIDISAAPKG